MGSLSYCPFLGWLVQVRSFLDGGGCLLLYAHYLHIRYGHEVGVHHWKRLSLICAYLPWAIRGNLGARCRAFERALTLCNSSGYAPFSPRTA